MRVGPRTATRPGGAEAGDDAGRALLAAVAGNDDAALAHRLVVVLGADDDADVALANLTDRDRRRQRPLLEDIDEVENALRPGELRLREHLAHAAPGDVAHGQLFLAHQLQRPLADERVQLLRPP